MKLRDIPSRLGITAAHLAEICGVSKQALNNYTSGRKGKPSQFVVELLSVTGLNREEIIFPDRFYHPDGENPDHPAYWANIAIEALYQASIRGLTEEKAQEISNTISEVVAPLISE